MEVNTILIYLTFITCLFKYDFVCLCRIYWPHLSNYLYVFKYYLITKKTYYICTNDLLLLTFIEFVNCLSFSIINKLVT